MDGLQDNSFPSSNEGSFNVTIDEDDELLSPVLRDHRTAKRQRLDDGNEVLEFICRKRLDFGTSHLPSPTPPPASDDGDTDSSSVDITQSSSPSSQRFPASQVIEEFASPLRSNTNNESSLRLRSTRGGHQDSEQNTEQYSEFVGIGAHPTKRRYLKREFRAALESHALAVQKFAHNRNITNLDGKESITLLITRIFEHSDDKLRVTLCEHVELSIERYVLFKPSSDVIVGGVIKLYSPWKEMPLAGVASPVIYCTEFYRVGCKRDNYFGVSADLIKQVIMDASKHKKISASKVPADESLLSVFQALVPFVLKNPNTILKQTRLLQPTINLDAEVVQYKTNQPTSSANFSLTQSIQMQGETIVFLKDSDDILSLLQVSSCGASNEQTFLKAVSPEKRYFKFKNLGIVSKTNILQGAWLFRLIKLSKSNQAFYYTLCLRHDTKWEEALKPN